MRYLLTSNNTLIVRGEASFRLLDGEASVLGATLHRNNSLVVRPERQLPVEARTEADLDIFLGKSSEIFEVEGSTIPASWQVAADALTEMKQGKVMVIGATDVGKSTLCTYLANRLAAKGLSLRVVDGDIGQADIGPPTTIGSSVPTTSLSSLVELLPDALIFIGHTNPSQVETKIINGLQRLSNRGRDSLTIINTDGWVLDREAISYKIKMIAATEPDLVVALANGTELQPILSGSRAQSLSIETAKEVLARSRSDRREIRRSGFRRFLRGGRARTIALRKVTVSTPVGFPAFQGQEGRKLTSLIVGLLDDDNYLIQIGILMALEKDVLRVYCRTAEGARNVAVGYVKLSSDGTELGYFEPKEAR